MKLWMKPKFHSSFQVQFKGRRMLFLTCRPHSRDKASAGCKLPFSPCCRSELVWSRVQSRPAGRRSRPRCTAGLQTGPLEDRDPNIYSKTQPSALKHFSLKKFIFSIIRNTCLLPVLDLVCALHVINVHADLVVDVGRQVRRVGLHVRKHYPSPKLAVIQQTHGLVYQTLLIGHRLQLIQVHTLQGRMKIDSLSDKSRGQADWMMQFWQSKKSGPVYTSI